MRKNNTLTLLASAALIAGSTGAAQAAVVQPVEVFGHNESTNFSGSIGDMINGSGMNGYLVNGSPTWPTGEGLPSTWSLTPTGSFSGPAPLYGAEWQSQDILDGEPGDATATNGKIGWTIFDLGDSYQLDELYVWHIRENSGRVASDFNIYVAATPTVAPTHGPTNSTSADYNFASGGWTLVADGLAGTQSALTLVDLAGNSARYIGIEIIDNASTDTRVGFQEVAITIIPEPASLALAGLGALFMLPRRRR